VKIFVAGATGVIGRRLVPMLVRSGHEVTGMTRRSERSGQVEAMGALPAVCDVFDAPALEAAVAAASPEVVIHELTDLPAALDPRKYESQMAGNDRLRSEGTANLVAAARAAGAKRIVAQSIAFAYTPSGPAIKTESDPLFDDAPFPWSRAVAALHDLEHAVTQTAGIEGIVLRYGFFYGPGTAYAADGHLCREVAKRRIPLIGGGTGVFSFIQIDDAATATVAAIDGGTPGAIYNIVDDEPAPGSEWIPVYAEAMGAKPPRRVPRWLGRMIGGRTAVMMMTQTRGASNERAKKELGWSPRYPSWRTGFGAPAT